MSTDQETTNTKLKVAVIGTGIGGLAASWLLKEQKEIEVSLTLYERLKTFGLAAHSVSLPHQYVSSPSPYEFPQEKDSRYHHDQKKDGDTSEELHDTQFYIDVPLRVFSQKYYPTLSSLYRHLGVTIVPQDYSFSISSLSVSQDSSIDTSSNPDKTTFFSYSNFGWKNLFSFAFLNLRCFSIRSWRLIFDLLHLSYSSHLLMDQTLQIQSVTPCTCATSCSSSADCSCGSSTCGCSNKNSSSAQTRQGWTSFVFPLSSYNENLHEKSFGQFLKENNYSEDFINSFLVPCFSVICTCDRQQILDYPASVLLEYFSLMFVRTPLFRVAGGSRLVSDKLTQQIGIENCNFNSCVKSVYPRTLNTSDQLNKKVCIEFENGEIQVYDHVIIAGQANHASSLLFSRDNQQQPDVQNDELKKAFDSFQHIRSTVIIHTDTRLMPDNHKDWGPLNMFITETGETMVSVWMNKINPQFSSDLFQTWNPLVRPQDDKIIAERPFERPVLSYENAYKSLRTIQTSQGRNNIWFCGAYSLFQVPLLESAALSGLLVAQGITGCKELPWSSIEQDSTNQESNPVIRWFSKMREMREEERGKGVGRLIRMIGKVCQARVFTSTSILVGMYLYVGYVWKDK